MTYETVRENGRYQAILYCEYCGERFTRRLDVVLRDGLKQIVCSAPCATRLRSTKKEFTCVCGTKFYRTPSDLRISKSGNVFCSQACANSTSNRMRMGENHPGFKNGIGTYRRIAREVYGNACTVCGYAIDCVLEVHHRDGDRTNNSIENLDVLCPTHHDEFEHGVRVYEGLGSRLIDKATAFGAVETGSNPVSPANLLM